MVRRVALALVAFALTACGSKASGERACAQYKDTFLKSCTDTCTKALDPGTCTPKCAEALPKDPTYASKCLAAAASASK